MLTEGGARSLCGPSFKMVPNGGSWRHLVPNVTWIDMFEIRVARSPGFSQFWLQSQFRLDFRAWRLNMCLRALSADAREWLSPLSMLTCRSAWQTSYTVCIPCMLRLCAPRRRECVSARRSRVSVVLSLVLQGHAVCCTSSRSLARVGMPLWCDVLRVSYHHTCFHRFSGAPALLLRCCGC